LAESVNLNLEGNMPNGSHKENRIRHVIRKALIRHKIVLDLNDIKNLVGKILKGKYFVLDRKDCYAPCKVNREGCRLVCLMVHHKKGNNISPLPVLYCEVNREIVTILRKNCFEFKRWNNRRLSAD
jgi:hypothetical protein